MQTLIATTRRDFLIIRDRPAFPLSSGLGKSPTTESADEIDGGTETLGNFLQLPQLGEAGRRRQEIVLYLEKLRNLFAVHRET